MTVCFASWEGYHGCVSACRNAAGVLGGAAVALGTESIPREALECDLLVLSSWSPHYDALLKRRTGPIVGRWHSPLLQTELSREGWKLARLVELLDEGRLAGVALSDETLAAVLDRDRLVHLPEVLDEREYEGIRPEALGAVSVSLFCEPAGRKNLLVQSAAFELARRERGDSSWTLHLNGQTIRRPGYRRWLELASIPYVDHGFLPRREYLTLVASVDAGLSVTLSEGYGYVAADHAALGTPPVLSRAVRCLDVPELTVQQVGSVSDVKTALLRALERPVLASAARKSLRERARAHARLARAGLDRLMELAAAPVS